ncbi:MAG: TatD family hydrolase [Dehalococcoidia bacterium]
MYKLIDTHAHLDQVENLDAAIEKARDCGLIAIIAVGVDSESNRRVLEIAEKYESFIFPALGCHPDTLGKTGSEIEAELKFIEDNISEAVAVGEIGLDYLKRVRQQASKDVQQQVLKDVLQIAGRFDKPVSVHSRYSWKDCFEIVRDSGVSRAVFHWYSGPLSVLSQIHSEGFFTSATPAVEYGAEHARAIRETPFEQLMLETDTPVVYHRNTALARPSEPADVALRVLGKVAELKGIEPQAAARKTTENAIGFFGLSNQEIE